MYKKNTAPQPVRWGEKRFYSLDYYLKQTYGHKLYKVALDAGMTCPTRDGTLGTRGCIFCSAKGSGDFAADRSLSITEQLQQGKEAIRDKFHADGYIAYFQAFTNTYAPVEKLRRIFTEAIQSPDVEILSIATRPDCLGPEVLTLLDDLNHIKPVWVELGLQTIHPDSARFIRRGYELPVFLQAVQDLRSIGISVIVHVILGLPGETSEQMPETVRYLNALDIQGIKLQLLHVLEGTDLADYYRTHPFPVMTMDEYLELLGNCISDLRPDIVIHRLTGDGPSKLLIEPQWTTRKRDTLNRLNAYLKSQNIWQGRSYTNGRTTNTI